MGDAFDHPWCIATEKITLLAQFSEPPFKLEAGCGSLVCYQVHCIIQWEIVESLLQSVCIFVYHLYMLLFSHNIIANLNLCVFIHCYVCFEYFFPLWYQTTMLTSHLIKTFSFPHLSLLASVVVDLLAGDRGHGLWL